MSFNISTYKLIKSLSPFDVYEIITRGKYQHILEKEKPVMLSLFGDIEKSWTHKQKIDSLQLYLSDDGFQILTDSKQAKEIYDEIKSWNIFYNTYNAFYNDTFQAVGFSYNHNAFEVLYKEWKRNKILKEII